MLLLGIVGGCRGRTPDAEGSPPRDQLRRLMQGNEGEAKPPPLRLSRLAASDVGPPFQGRPACRLVHDADTLLIARGGAALARVDGKLATVPQAGPVDRSGAFFRGPGVTISIGGSDPRLSGGPASVSIGNGTNDPPQRLEAVWMCSG